MMGEVGDFLDICDQLPRVLANIGQKVGFMSAPEFRYKPLHRAIVFGAKCHICPRYLTSHTAYVLLNDNGEEHLFGPTCAKKVLDAEGRRQLKSVPDFTSALSSPPDEEEVQEAERAGTARPTGGRTIDETAPNQQELRYMLLRQRVLSHIPQAGYRGFEDYARTYDQTGLLDEEARSHINNLMKKQKDKKFGLRSLLTVYAYDSALAHVLSKPKYRDNEFLNSIRAHLHRKLYLSPSQVEHASTDLPAGVTLNPSGFCQPDPK